MDELKRENTIHYFSDRVSHFRDLAHTLKQDDRADEAVFARVRMNVYDIFSAVFSAAVKTAGQDDEKAVQFFLKKIEQIPQSWRTALANAELHGETEKAHIERIKLEAAGEIQTEFKRLWEVST